MLYTTPRINRFPLHSKKVKSHDSNSGAATWCGNCFRPIVSDIDSDLLELLTSDSLCQCEGDVLD